MCVDIVVHVHVGLPHSFVCVDIVVHVHVGLPHSFVCVDIVVHVHVGLLHSFVCVDIVHVATLATHAHSLMPRRSHHPPPPRERTSGVLSCHTHHFPLEFQRV